MKEMNIVSIDPLFVPKVEIIQSEDSPVNIKLFTRNVDLVGFSKLRITKAMWVYSLDISSQYFTNVGKFIIYCFFKLVYSDYNH